MILHEFKGYGSMKKTRNGKYLAIASKKIEVYDSTSFKKVAEFRNIRHPSSIAFSSDSRLMAVKNTSGLINLYNLVEMSFITSFQPSEREGSNILFTPDNENILSSDWDGNIYRINIHSEKIETIRQYENFLLEKMDYDEQKKRFYMIASQKRSDKNMEPTDDYSILIEWQYPFVESSLRERKISYKTYDVKYNHVHDGYIAVHDSDLIALNSDYKVIKTRRLKDTFGMTRLDWSADGKLILLLNGSILELIDYESFDVINTFEFSTPLDAEFVIEDDCKTFSCGTFYKTYYIDLQKVEKSENPIVIK